jgi:hypothetical protein
MANDDPPGIKNSNDDSSKQVEEASAVEDPLERQEGDEASTNGAQDTADSTAPTTDTSGPTTPAATITTTTTTDVPVDNSPSQVVADGEPQVVTNDNDDDEEEEGNNTGTTENEKTAADSPGYSADQSLLSGSTDHIAIHKHHAPIPADAVPVEVAAVATESVEAETAAQDTDPTSTEQGLSTADDVVARQIIMANDEVVLPPSSSPQQQLDPQQKDGGAENESKLEQLEPDPLLVQIIENSKKEAYVNVGLVHWEKQRLAWLAMNRNTTSKYGGDTDETSSSNMRDPFQAIPVDVDEIIDVIFQSPKQWREEGGPRRFPCAVPLPQMVDILQDLWEAEGLDT